jgi:cytochrome bd ubiquinol oxidase subunit II
MAELWFAVLSLTLIAYAVLDGFDFGVGAILLLCAKTDQERRDAIAAIGPFWDGNEVWLISAGGVLFVAFPHALATAFPAFYLALFLVLWCLALRGIAIEVRSQVKDAMWRAFWDLVFAGASALLALLFGVALGNLVRGVPLGPSGQFTMPFFTNFLPSGQVGLLDWYTLSVGVFAVLVLMIHGALFLAWRTEGELEARALELARRLAIACAIIFLLLTAGTAEVRFELFQNLSHRPLGIVFALAAVTSAVLFVRALRRRRALHGFLASSALLASLLAATAVGVYPTLLYSTLGPEQSLTAAGAAAPSYSLSVAIAWWPFAFALAVSYFTMAFRANRRKVSRR